MAPLLSRWQRQKLLEHRYSCLNQSVLDALLQPWWNLVVGYLPLWLAPNLLTLSGLVLNVSTSLLYLSHAPDAASWVPMVAAMGLLVYQTLDAVDGKQARRLGQSNCLGELLDHGCDSISALLLSLSGSCMMQLHTQPYLMLYMSMTTMVLFYLAHWQTYVTGTLRFGKMDVTELQMAMILAMFFTALMGPDIWNVQVVSGLPVKWLVMLMLSIIVTSGLPGSIRLILFHGAGKNGSTVAGTSVISPLVPVLLLMVPGVYVAAYSTLFARNPVVFILTFGLIGVKITNKLIVAQMSRHPLPMADWIFLVPALIFTNLYLRLGLPDTLLLHVCLVWVLFDLIWYCGSICNEICQATGWNFLTVNHQANAQIRTAASTSSRRRH